MEHFRENVRRMGMLADHETIASREGGARVEREEIEGRTVVHNYGIAGAGYQASW